LAIFVGQGFTHILPSGLDHVLFVLGLFLLSARIRPLLWQVSAFTLAHCITLALATLGLFSLPAVWVEPLIALSIVYVGVEDLCTDKLSSWRASIIFAFGLLHGLGFAAALSDLQSLQGSSLLVALIGFNVGVEAGQIAVLILAFADLGWFRERSWYRRFLVRPAALGIAATGALWTVQRILEG
jgi:hydrogenase/urease accessory protein HupE